MGMCSQKVDTTLVFDLEIGGDQWWCLTSDPCGKRFSGLRLVILYYLDLSREWDKFITTFTAA